MRIPPIAGPTTRAEFITTLLRLTAFCSWSRPTISSTNVWRAGLSTTLTKPSRNAMRYTFQTAATPAVTMIAESQRQQAGGDLRAEQQAALVEAVGEHAAPRPEQQHRQELQRGDDAERGAVLVGQLEDEPRLRDVLHPRAADRDRLPDEVEAVVAVAERRERVASEAADARHRGSSRSCSSSTAARASTARSSALSVRRRCAR